MRIVVLISGSGSNFHALIEHFKDKVSSAQIVAVLTNRPQAGGLSYAKEAGIDEIVVDHTQFEDRSRFDQAMMQAIDAYQPDLVVLAGFMRILTAEFVEHYLGKMLNIHPSLLPKYPGVKTHARVLEAGDAEHGASVHFVTPELDGGPIIAQCKITVSGDDTADTLAARLLKFEHQLYPQVVEWFVEKRLRLEPSGAYLDDQAIPAEGILLEFGA